MNISRVITSTLSGGLKGHFGQYAEDVLVRKYFPHNTRGGRYLDVGAYHPFKYSNTAYFWLRGWSGINIDANPKSIELFNRYRAGDINIWAAVLPEVELRDGKESAILALPYSTDTTIDISGIGSIIPGKSALKGRGMEIEVPVKSLNNILMEHGLSEIDLLSLDVEGYDERIILDFNFDYCLPRMIIVEDFSDSFDALLASKITTHLVGHEYKLVGRAGLSSVFSFRGLSY